MHSLTHSWLHTYTCMHTPTHRHTHRCTTTSTATLSLSLSSSTYTTETLTPPHHHPHTYIYTHTHTLSLSLSLILSLTHTHTHWQVRAHTDTHTQTHSYMHMFIMTSASTLDVVYHQKLALKVLNFCYAFTHPTHSRTHTHACTQYLFAWNAWQANLTRWSQRSLTRTNIKINHHKYTQQHQITTQRTTCQHKRNTEVNCTEKPQQFTGQSILWSCNFFNHLPIQTIHWTINLLLQDFLNHTLFTGFPQSLTHKNNHSLGFLSPWKSSSLTDIRQYWFWKFRSESSRLSLYHHALACEEDMAAILVFFMQNINCDILIGRGDRMIGGLESSITEDQLLTITPGGPGSPSMPGSPGSPWKEKHTQLSKPALGWNHNSCLFGSVTSRPPPEMTVWLMLKSSHWFFQRSW